MAKKVPDELIITALIEKRGNITATAEAVGLNRRTVQLRMKDGKFIAKYQAARDQLIDGACHVLQGSVAAAAQHMIDVMDNPVIPASIRLNAATMVLDRAVKLTELCNILPRLEKLEHEKGVSTDDR